MSAAAHQELVELVRRTLTDGEIEFTEPTPSSSSESTAVFDVVLPGERKLQTPVRLEVGPHALAVHAFVCRRPDENVEGVYRWLLERNMKLFGVAFALDAVGDVYLDGRLPLAVVSSEEIDRLLGAVLTYADESFNPILELGFASSIRKEWEWRLARGESTRNLEAFQALRPGTPSA
ncbi:MAG: YbjN domain-containing protein [Marmoricola sp.]